jgi:hypothetical protein
MREGAIDRFAIGDGTITRSRGVAASAMAS